ncbi:MAG: hypothetical protein JXR56_00570 [Candidatus Cloacimonetes bacterium]|nr:hypothetical protein [Candidatus Cloacimonadota bacterium]
MKKLIILLFMLLVLHLQAQNSDELNLQDVKIEGDDEKIADFHVVHRDLSEYIYIDRPNYLRYKYFARSASIPLHEDQEKLFRSYSEFFFGSSSFVDIRTAFKDFNNPYLDLSLDYRLRTLSDEWSESQAVFSWNPYHFKKLKTDFKVSQDDYKVDQHDNNLSGFEATFDLTDLIEAKIIDKLGLSGRYYHSSYYSKSDLSDIRLNLTSNFTKSINADILLMLQTGSPSFSVSLNNSFRKLDWSVWVAGDQETVVPSLGFNYYKDFGRYGHISLSNTPAISSISYKDALEIYHYLDLQNDYIQTKKPLNLSLLYGNGRIIPFTFEIKQEYLLDYPIIDPFSDVEYKYYNFPLLSAKSVVSFKKKSFGIKNELLYHFAKQIELEYVNGLNYQSIPYIAELENVTKTDIIIDRFVFSAVFVYSSSKYSHLNEEMEPSGRLNFSAEYKIKNSFSLHLYADNILNETTNTYSNYAKEKREFGIGTKISLK